MLGNSPLACRPLRWACEMFDSYHCAIESQSSRRKTITRNKGKFSSPLPIFFFHLSSLSLTHSISQATGEATMRENESEKRKVTRGTSYGPVKREQQKLKVLKTTSKDAPFHPRSPHSTPVQGPYAAPHLSSMPCKMCTITMSQQATVVANGPHHTDSF
jgi:hypothetical protein